MLMPKRVQEKQPECTRWFKYDRDDLCVNKSQFVPVIFEPPCTLLRTLHQLEVTADLTKTDNNNYSTRTHKKKIQTASSVTT
jgi:hypothetical protein